MCWYPPSCSLEELVDAVAEVPLKFPPGEGFEYGLGLDVCARLVEVLSGQPFDRYLQEHIFDPLGMVDTGFSLTATQAARAVRMYEMSEAGELLECGETWWFFAVPRPQDVPKLHTGGHGLWSTAPDVMRFALMLRGGGALAGQRLLSPTTVRLLTRNHLPGAVDVEALGGSFPDFPTSRGLGFGLGPAVVLGSDFGMHCSDGSYFWQGVGSTYHFHDPAEDLTLVAMTQFIPVSAPAVQRNRYALVALAQQAVVD